MTNKFNILIKKIMITFYILAFLIPNFVQGVDLKAQNPNLGESQNNLPCMDYYPYGALTISASLDKGYYNPNEEATLSLQVKNTHNKTSINNGSVILQIRKLVEQETAAHTILLNEQVIGENLIFAKGQTIDNKLKFNIPDLPAGLYQAYINITDNNYVVSGLSFTQDITGATVAFMIDNTSKPNFDIPYIEEMQSIIGKDHSNPFFPPPSIEQGKFPLNMTLPIYNSSGQTVSVDISSKLYYWDERDKSPQELKNETLNIVASSTKPITFSIPAITKAGTYMVKSILTYDKYQVISKIRFTVPGYAPAVYYSGVADGKFFSCVGNTTNVVKKDDKLTGSVKMSLTNDKGKEVGSFSSIGEVAGTSTPMIFSQDYNSSNDATNLKTSVYDQNGNLINETNIGIPPHANDKLTFITVIKNNLLYATGIFVLLLLSIMLFNKKRIGKVVISVIFFVMIMALSPMTAKAENSSSGYLAGYWPEHNEGIQVFYSASVDFIIPNKILSGTNFNLVKSNYAGFYQIFGYWDSPLFNFTKDNINFNGEALLDGSNPDWGLSDPAPPDVSQAYSDAGYTAGYGNYLSTVDTKIPYNDVWTTSDARLTCVTKNVNDVTCAAQTGLNGNVNITLTRTFNVSSGHFYSSNFLTQFYSMVNFLTNPPIYGQGGAISSFTLTQTKTVYIEPAPVVPPSPVIPPVVPPVNKSSVFKGIFIGGEINFPNIVDKSMTIEYDSNIVDNPPPGFSNLIAPNWLEKTP